MLPNVLNPQEGIMQGKERGRQEGGYEEGDLLLAPFLRVLLVPEDEDADLALPPVLPPGQEVGHQQRQTWGGRG